MSTVLEVVKENQDSSSLFSPNSKISFSLSSVYVSALNFVRLYQGDSSPNYYDRIELSFAESLKVADLLLGSNQFRDIFDLTWDVDGQSNYERKECFKPRQYFNVFNKLDKTYPECIEDDFVELILSNYIQTFVENIKGDYSRGIFFKHKDDVLKNAMKSQNKGLVQVLVALNQNPKLNLGFKCCGEDFDKSIPFLYSQK